MATSVSLSTRVSPDLRQQLLAEARARRVALGTLARDLLEAGVEGAPPASDDAVQNEVRCIFAHLPPEAGLRREICLSLARTVEAGGTAGISAARALLDEVRVTQRLLSLRTIGTRTSTAPRVNLPFFAGMSWDDITALGGRGSSVPRLGPA
jgi:hypothetical protein